MIHIGTYDGDDVAVKIIWSKESMENELKVFTALNATKDPKIENYGIPRVYYHGDIFGTHNAIVMTLFTETLYDRYTDKVKHLSNLDLLRYFKRAVCLYNFEYRFRFLIIFFIFFLELRLKYLNILTKPTLYMMI